MHRLMEKPAPPGWREIVLVGLVVGTLGLVLALPPIPQDPAYHAFADERALFGVARFLNMASNLPFALVGALGLLLCARQPGMASRRAWQVMFAGVVLVTAGSAWYHAAPDSERLVWDRLPMAVAFMGLFVALLNEHVHPRLERLLLWPACLLGAGSVFYWQATDDLRFYAWVQFFPLLALLVVVLFFPGARGRRGALAAAFALYALGKLAEWQDAAVFHLTGELLSGHSLKHLLAAAGIYVIYRMLRMSRTHTPVSQAGLARASAGD
jgi:hypothetical protein